MLWTLAFTIPQRVQSSIHWKLWFQTLDAASCLGGSSFLVPQFRLKQGLKSDCCCRRLGRISVGHGTFSCPVSACSSHPTAWLPWWICSTIFSSCSSTCGAAREARLSRQWKPKHARSCISCVGRFDSRLCTTQLGRNRFGSSWLSSGKAQLPAGHWCCERCHLAWKDWRHSISHCRYCSCTVSSSSERGWKDSGKAWKCTHQSRGLQPIGKELRSTRRLPRFPLDFGLRS